MCLILKCILAWVLLTCIFSTMAEMTNTFFAWIPTARKCTGQQPGLHHNLALNMSILIAWALSCVRWQTKSKSEIKIYLPFTFIAKQWAHAWWWPCFSEGVFLRTLRSMLETWHWSKCFGFSSVGPSLEFWSHLELKFNRNTMCIFISTIFLVCFHFYFLPGCFYILFFSHLSSSITFFPVSSLLVNTPPAYIYLWWSSSKIRLEKLWVLYGKLNGTNEEEKFVQFLWMNFWVKKKSVKLMDSWNVIM